MKLRLSSISQAPTWTVTLAIAVLALAFILFVFLPFQRNIRNLSQQLREKRLHVVQADLLVVPIARDKERLDEVRRHNDQWEQHAPDPEELAAVYARISDQARAVDLQLVKFEPLPPKNLQTLRQYAVALSIQGDFEQIYQFLARVERLPQTIWPTQLRVTQVADGAASLQGEMTLTFFGDLAGSAD